MENQLTARAIECIFHSIEDPKVTSQPVLQVINIKKLAPQPQAKTPDRYRLIVSDGIHFMQAMLGTQLNQLVLNNRLEKYTLMKLNNFVCNSLQNRRILIVVNVEIVGKHPERIGNPQSIENHQFSGETQQPQVPPAPVNVNSFQLPASKSSAPPSSESGFASPSFNYNYTNTTPSQHNQTASAPRTPIYPIKGLNLYINKFTIKARVTSKSAIRHWSNARGEGKLFNVVLLDDSGEIQATAFNAQVDQFYDLLQEGQVYYLSNGKLQPARQQFSSVANEYQMTLEQNTEILLCAEPTDLPMMSYNFVPLNKLMEVDKDATIDVIGVVREIQELSHVVSKTTQKQVNKRDLVIVDDSQYAVRITLWGNQAETFGETGSPVIACKGVRVGDFGGRSLSLFNSSVLSIEGDIPEAHKLRGWYDQVGHALTFHTYSQSQFPGSAEGGTRVDDQRKTIAQLKDENLGMGMKPDYYTLRGTIVQIREKNIHYPACKSEGCNKKVFQDSTGWRCEKCQVSFDEPDYRYILSVRVCDYTGQEWFQAFNDIAQAIIGKNANELAQYSEEDNEFKVVILESTFNEYLFRCRAKQETFNDTMRVRHSIVSIRPIDFVQQSHELVQSINTAMQAQ